MLAVLKSRDVTPKLINDFKILYKELSPGSNLPLTIKSLRAMIAKRPASFVVWYENITGQKTAVGMGSIHHYDPMDKRKAIIENCVVLEKFRRRGIATAITNELIRIAKKRKVKEINLGSGLQRTGAHKFYEKLDFKISSFMFRMKLN